jgi:hypothetical protein
MNESCILAWVFLVLAIMLFACGCVGCCRAASEGRKKGKKQGGDVEMRWNPRECRMEPVSPFSSALGAADALPPPPPPTKSWSPEERRALARAVSRLPPSCIQEVRAIIGGDVSTVFFASLDVSVCDRVQQYVDAQPSRDSLAGLSGLAFMCVGPAFYGFWFFAIRCAFTSI